MSDCLIVIPSRLGSTRFPGKVLALLDGKPIVQWCYESAIAAKIGDVLVATESDKVADKVRSFGGTAVLTSPQCVSGTDRVWEAAKAFPAQKVINVQGDQPFIKPQTIRAVVERLDARPRPDIATAVMPLSDEERVSNPNVVKAVLTAKGQALYFSRSPIPYPRNDAARRFEHLGIYGFQREALERFVKLPPSPLERTESLEQLRALEDGMTIYAAVVSDVPVAIDTPQDLALAERLLSSRSKT